MKKEYVGFHEIQGPRGHKMYNVNIIHFLSLDLSLIPSLVKLMTKGRWKWEINEIPKSTMELRKLKHLITNYGGLWKPSNSINNLQTLLYEDAKCFRNCKKI